MSLRVALFLTFGALTVVGGVALFSPRVALIVGGALLIGVGVLHVEVKP